MADPDRETLGGAIFETERPVVVIYEPEVAAKEALERLLRRLGCEPEALTDLDEIRDRVAVGGEAPVVLVLAAFGGAEALGLRLVRMLRRHVRGRALDVRIAVVAPDDTPETCAAVLEAGADALLRAPVTSRDVRRLVASLPQSGTPLPEGTVADERVLDLEALSVFAPVGRDDLDGLEAIADWSTRVAEQVGHLNTACAAADWPALHRWAHRLKGAAYVVGAVRVAKLCAELEHLGAERQGDDVPALLARLSVEIDTAVAAFAVWEADWRAALAK